MNKLTILLAALSSTLVLSSCGDEGFKCGTGTIESGGSCIATNADGGGSLSCGAGTVESQGECVANAGPDASLGQASIASIDPAIGLVGGGEPFTITGSGFLAQDAGATTLSFGDNLAEFAIVSDTEIRGTTPAASSVGVTVTLTNSNGAATTDFSYQGLYGGDGKTGLAGNLYLIDPRNGAALAIGAIESAGPVGHAVTGMVFDPAGTGDLLATESTKQNAGASLLRINALTGETTVIGPLDDGAATNHDTIAGLTTDGATLVGWTEDGDDVVTIDPATGLVTVLGDSAVSSNGSAMTTLVDGTVIAAPNEIGDYFSINTTTGEATLIDTLTGPAPAQDPGAINSMTTFRGQVYLTLNADVGDANSIALLATLDTTTHVVTPIGLLPNGMDALASNEIGTPTTPAPLPMAPSAALQSILAKIAQGCKEGQSGALRTLDRRGRELSEFAATELAASPNSLAMSAKRAGVRGLPLSSLAKGHGLTIQNCGGVGESFSAGELAKNPARYLLVSNQRGKIKLVDQTTGRPLLHDVAIARQE